MSIGENCCGMGFGRGGTAQMWNGVIRAVREAGECVSMEIRRRSGSISETIQSYKTGDFRCPALHPYLLIFQVRGSIRAF